MPNFTSRLLFTTLVCLAVMLVTAVRVSAQELELAFFDEANELTDNIILESGKSQLVQVVVSANSDVASLSGKLVLPLADLSVTNVEQNYEFCQLWDSDLRYADDGIEFTCARVPQAAALGEEPLRLMQLELVAADEFSGAQLEFADSLFANRDGEVDATVVASVLDLQSVNRGVSQTSGEVATGAGQILAINIILAILMVSTIALSIRSYRLTK